MPRDRFNNAREQGFGITITSHAFYVDETFRVVIDGPFNGEDRNHQAKQITGSEPDD